ATVLDSVEERHAGIASGVNNGVSRVAGLLAIAILGAVISAQFGSVLTDKVEGGALTPAASRAIEDAKAQPLGLPKTAGLDPAEGGRVRTAARAASTSAFRLGLGISAALMILGGIVAGIGIENPRRRA